MPQAHASREHLTAYAAGTLSGGMSLLVASHLTYCPDCRCGVRAMEAIGGALLAATPADAVAAPSLAEALARLDADHPPTPSREPEFESHLPHPIRARLVACSGGWRRLLPGLAQICLEGFPGEDVRLLRARPGTRIPAHDHDAEEATLVLAGRMRDGARIFGRGDVALAHCGQPHRPEVVGPEPCLCLVVLGGRLRFTGPLGRVLNFLGR